MKNNEVVDDIIEYLVDNLYDDIKLDEMEKEFCYHKVSLTRLFKQYTGLRMREFINYLKIINSINMLLYTNESINDIALASGYKYQVYYSKVFQKVIGIPPIKFRKCFRNIDKIKNIEELEKRKEYLLSLETYKNNLIDGITLDNKRFKKLVLVKKKSV